jgi:hypothetical protein
MYLTLPIPVNSAPPGATKLLKPPRFPHPEDPAVLIFIQKDFFLR